MAVYVEQLKPRGLQALHDHPGEASQQVVAEVVVLPRTCRAGSARRTPWRGRRRSRGRRTRCGRARRATTSPARHRRAGSGGSAPRAGGHRSRARRPLGGSRRRRRPALPPAAGRRRLRRRGSRHSRRSARAAPQAFPRTPGRRPGARQSRASSGRGRSPRSVARMAAASSVMSMATGHHVMQRPQPMQPEVPN